MSARTVVALILGALACALAFGAWLLLGLDRSGSSASVAVVLVPGLLYGAAFEVIALLPYLWWLKRRRSLTRGRVVIGGLTLWAVASALQLVATSELPFLHATALLPALMVPGIALVVVVALTMRYEPAEHA